VSAGSSRGRIETINLKSSIVLNGNPISKARIEIDHINYGLDKKTGELNKRRRTSFTVSDIEKFILMLNGEYLMAREHRKRISRFEVRLDCPVPGKFRNKEFILIFETDYDKPSEINTITLFPGWRK
jgi:hypothetical protein